MDTITVCVSTIGHLEDTIRSVSAVDEVKFTFVAGTCTLGEAATIFCRLQSHVASSGGRWAVDAASMKILRQAAEHHDELDLLEIFLDLVELDLKDELPMSKKRFDAVRATANAVVTTANTSRALHLLDDVVIEAQRVARLCRELGFRRANDIHVSGRDDDVEASYDIKAAILTQEDIDWLTEDGELLADVGGELLADGNGGGVLADAGNLDGSDVLAVGTLLAGSVADALAGDGIGAKVLAGSGAGVGVALMIAGNDDGADALVGDGIGAKVLVGSDAGVGEPLLLAGNGDGVEALAGDGVEAKLHPGSGAGVGGLHADQLGAWVEMKQKTVTGLLLLKIHKLRDALKAAKGRVVRVWSPSEIS